MCDRDHLPVGHLGGLEFIICDDVPKYLSGIIYNSAMLDDHAES